MSPTRNFKLKWKLETYIEKLIICLYFCELFEKFNFLKTDSLILLLSVSEIFYFIKNKYNGAWIKKTLNNEFKKLKKTGN